MLVTELHSPHIKDINWLFLCVRLNVDHTTVRNIVHLYTVCMYPRLGVQLDIRVHAGCVVQLKMILYLCNLAGFVTRYYFNNKPVAELHSPHINILNCFFFFGSC